MLMVIFAAIAANRLVPESGTTLMTSCGILIGGSRL